MQFISFLASYEQTLRRFRQPYHPPKKPRDAFLRLLLASQASFGGAWYEAV